MKKSKTNNKGITLIALTITIIVLLILSGISINTLLGDGGLIKRAENARAVWEESEIEKQLEVNVMESYDKNFNLNISDLKKNLIKGLGIDSNNISGNTFPLTVNVNGYVYSIDENGNINKK